jgi:hypothetical protein
MARSRGRQPAVPHDNRQVIAGRHGTEFRSAFFVRLPIAPEAIVRVWQPEQFTELPSPDYHIYNFQFV